jgi:transposase-like protein
MPVQLEMGKIASSLIVSYRNASYQNPTPTSFAKQTVPCPLCNNSHTRKHGKTSKGSQRYFCLNCRQTFSETFNTFYYRRQVNKEDVQIVLQSYAEGISLRGISRISGLAYNTVVKIVHAGNQKEDVMKLDQEQF